MVALGVTELSLRQINRRDMAGGAVRVDAGRCAMVRLLADDVEAVVATDCKLPPVGDALIMDGCAAIL